MNSWAIACMDPAGGALEEAAAPGAAGALASASASCQPSAGTVASASAGIGDGALSGGGRT
eukprot:759246-Alexandrium_andersonii.AAC.1